MELNHVAYSEHPARAALSVCCWSHPVTPLGVALYRSARGAPLSVRSRLARVKVGSRRRRALCGGSALALPTGGNLPDTLVSTRYIVISNRGPGQAPMASFLHYLYSFLDPALYSTVPAALRDPFVPQPPAPAVGQHPCTLAMASTRLAAVLSAARGVSCADASRRRPRCRRHRLTQSVVTALGPRSPPATPSRRRSTWCTPGEVPARVAGRQLDAARDAVRRRPTGGRRRAPVRPAAGSIRPLNARLQGGPQPPAARSAAGSASNGAQGASPGVGGVSTGRSGG